MASEDGDTSGKPVAEFLDSKTCFGGTAHDWNFITCGGRRICGEIEFVEAQNGLNACTCCSDDVAIDQTSAQGRIGDCGNDDHVVDVGDDYALAPFIHRVGPGEHGAPRPDSA